MSAGCRRQMLYYRRNHNQEPATPIAERLVLPQGYGQTTETLTWTGACPA